MVICGNWGKLVFYFLLQLLWQENWICLHCIQTMHLYVRSFWLVPLSVEIDRADKFRSGYGKSRQDRVHLHQWLRELAAVCALLNRTLFSFCDYLGTWKCWNTNNLLDLGTWIYW